MENKVLISDPQFLEQFSVGPIEQQEATGEVVLNFFTFCCNGQHYIAPREAIEDMIILLTTHKDEFALSAELGAVMLSSANTPDNGITVQ